MLAPLMPTADSMAATKAYVDAMVATAGVPEVPLVPTGQTWARQTGQWVPISEQEGTFLPLAGGTMQGQINMSGYAINNLAALPNMPNGAAPANWVLQQIASVSLYQGTWNMDTYTPDLTNPNTHVNGYTWIAITTSTSGVVIGPAIPGLQGQTVFNGDTIIWSNIQGQFNRIHSGGLSLAEAQALFLPFTGGTMTGPLLAFENPTETMEVATMGWVQSLIPTGGIIPEAPTDGQLYGRNGLTKVWLPVLPLAGGVMTGPILLSGNATNALNPVPLQQLTGTLASTYMPLAGGVMTGLLTLSGNASANLNPVPLQQLNAMLGSYLPLGGGTLSGLLNANGGINQPLATGPTGAAGCVSWNLTNTGGGWTYTAAGIGGLIQVPTIGGLAFYVAPAGAAGAGATLTQLLGLTPTGANFSTNVGVGVALPADMGPPSVGAGGGAQIMGSTANFATLALNAYVDTTGAWRRSHGTNAPSIINTGPSLTALYVGAAGAVDGLVPSWHLCAAFGQSGIEFNVPGLLGAATFFAFGMDTAANNGAVGVYYLANGAYPPGSNGAYVISSPAISGSYYAIVAESVTGALTSCTGWDNANATFTWSVAASDRRLKSNLSPAIGDALATVNAIDVYDCDYQHPATDAPPERWDYTLVADEVQAHLPFAYLPAPDHEHGYASLHPLHLVATLWKAVQQLSAQVKALQPA